MTDNETDADEHVTGDEPPASDSDASGGSDSPDEPGTRLGELDAALETQSYPITNAELVEAFGGYEVETQDGWTSLEELLDAGNDDPYDTADDVRRRILGLINRR